MKVVLEDAYHSASQGRLGGCDVVFLPSPPISADAFMTTVAGAEVLGLRGGLAFPLDAKVLGESPTLRFIQKSGTGIDRFNVGELSRRRILLASNAGVNAVAVAEHTLLLMLLCLHHPRPHMEGLREGRWRDAVPNPTPTQLSGKILGIIGMGDIGATVARYAATMGAQVLAVTRSNLHRSPLPPHVQGTTLADLLPRSDVVSLHVPLTDQTEGLIGEPQFRIMKTGAVLINTSRGRVVDEDALTRALLTGKLAAAGIDVFEQEPTSTDNPLLALENVYATPHLAGFTVESNAMQLEASLANIERYVAGERPHRLVNPEVWEAFGQ